MRQDVPTLHTIVDVLTARAEWADESGLLAERDALLAARERIVEYVFREERHRTILGMILDRLHIRKDAA
jgi:hypothetical protein